MSVAPERAIEALRERFSALTAAFLRISASLGEDAQSPTWIFNVRGVGYRMAYPRGA